MMNLALAHLAHLQQLVDVAPPLNEIQEATIRAVFAGQID